jgi:hypothetical protein
MGHQMHVAVRSRASVMRRAICATPALSAAPSAAPNARARRAGPTLEGSCVSRSMWKIRARSPVAEIGKSNPSTIHSSLLRNVPHEPRPDASAERRLLGVGSMRGLDGTDVDDAHSAWTQVSDYFVPTAMCASPSSPKGPSP